MIRAWHSRELELDLWRPNHARAPRLEASWCKRTLMERDQRLPWLAIASATRYGGYSKMGLLEVLLEPKVLARNGTIRSTGRLPRMKMPSEILLEMLITASEF
ncbi:hypothetical protein VNO77_04476 [Canavalia gladiata]|uniref:Uncharacterized protein n=1 Tax=Canavalia gladiata TaxID=3824 RepID=A0AAN9MWK7_CANGL